MLKVETLMLGAMQTCCYIAYNTESMEAVIVDPGAQPEKIIAAADSLSVNVRHILLTHAHFDHIGAVDALVLRYNCAITVSQADEQLLYDPHLNLSHNFRCDITVGSKNIITVNDSKAELIGNSFEFIITPGHTNGSMCIKTGNIIFTGDTLFYCSVGNDFPPYGSIEREIKSIKDKLLVLNGDYICYPGHGRSTTLDFERRNNPYLHGA